MDIESLINPEEIEELARQYGPVERRSYSLERDGERCEYWRRALAKRRGEVIFVVERPAGVILHTKDIYPSGTYRLPSGGVSWGESVLSALHREVREEMGLEIEVKRFLGLLEYQFRCQKEALPFVSYVFLVRGGRGEPVPQDKEEHILSFRQVPVAELAAVADSLRAVEEDWRDWGEFRAIAHDFVVEMLVLSLSKQWEVSDMTMTLQRYIDRRVASPLEEAFEEMMGTETGRRLAESSAQRRARYILDPTGKLGWGSMTVNLVRLVLIGKETLQDRPALINSLAHEASHIEQKYISDSFEQEYEAFVTAAQVMTEFGLHDPFGWDAPELQSLSPEQAAHKIMEMFPDHPLYGMNPAIPVYQVRGLRGLIELAKQAWVLLKAA